MLKNPFDAIKKAISRETKTEKRLIRHSKEREIIDIALETLSLSNHGQRLLEFKEQQNVKITILRATSARDYTSNAQNAYVSIPETMDIDDPDIIIHLSGALREAMQEYEPEFKRPDVNNGEAFFIHRMGEKADDKLSWQGLIVFELGKFANRTEFIDSFATMGYYSLIETYENKLTEIS